MKTKNWMLSVAMFAIAIVGAFAISSTAQEDLYYRTFEDQEIPCNNISVDCLGGDVQCQVNSPDGVRAVWQNLGCSVAQMHPNSTPLNPNP